jgi:hypothetical protein
MHRFRRTNSVVILPFKRCSLVQRHQHINQRTHISGERLSQHTSRRGTLWSVVLLNFVNQSPKRQGEQLLHLPKRLLMNHKVQERQRLVCLLNTPCDTGAGLAESTHGGVIVGVIPQIARTAQQFEHLSNNVKQLMRACVR